MKIAATIARYLLGLIFLIFGLNGFLHFIPMPPPSGIAGQFLGAMAATSYMAQIFLLQIIGGALLLAGRFVPLALAILAPIIVNIFLFHSSMAPEGLPLAAVVLVLWLLAYSRVRVNFAGLFAQRTDA